MIDKIKIMARKAILKAKKHSPEIFLAVGVVSGIAGAVEACKATTKIDYILKESKEEIDKINKYVEENGYSEKYSKEDKVKDQAIVLTKAAVKFAKLYAPAIGLGVFSISSILVSHNILKERNAAIGAAYAAANSGFRNYRNRVVERFGEEVDKELRFGAKEQKIEEIVKDENGKERKVSKKKKVIDSEEGNPVEHYSDFARYFDQGSPYWEKESEYNLVFLKTQQQYANDKLIADGFLFLNDVYDMLGIPRTKAGQIVGWIYDPEGVKHGKNFKGGWDNYVDFGIYDATRSVTRDFVNGYENVIILDFNVDGNILDLM